MSQNVTQWLDEIKALKQQLAEAHREREEAYASASNWQRLYETEAQQRRIEANLTRQTIASLEQEIQQLKGRVFAPQAEGTEATEIQAAVERISNETELKARLVQALAECDRLNKALQIEQANHAQTRKSLTTALGDAIDALKEKS